jgi:hypothetical protein
VAGVVVDISMSLDGFVAGPGDGLGRGLGEGGEAIHNWVMGGDWTYDDGTPFQASGVDREVLDEVFSAAGAVIVGRRMYDVVDGWGDESPFDRPVFVVTSRPHAPRAAGRPDADPRRACPPRRRQAAVRALRWDDASPRTGTRSLVAPRDAHSLSIDLTPWRILKV